MDAWQIIVVAIGCDSITRRQKYAESLSSHERWYYLMLEEIKQVTISYKINSYLFSGVRYIFIRIEGEDFPARLPHVCDKTSLTGIQIHTIWLGMWTLDHHSYIFPKLFEVDKYKGSLCML